MKLIIDYPETLPDLLHESREELEMEMRLALAVKLFELKRISSGTAAKLAGMDRVIFIMNLSRYGVAAIDMSREEIESDITNV